MFQWPTQCSGLRVEDVGFILPRAWPNNMPIILNEQTAGNFIKTLINNEWRKRTLLWLFHLNIIIDINPLTTTCSAINSTAIHSQGVQGMLPGSCGVLKLKAPSLAHTSKLSCSSGWNLSFTNSKAPRGRIRCSDIATPTIVDFTSEQRKYRNNPVKFLPHTRPDTSWLVEVLMTKTVWMMKQWQALPSSHHSPSTMPQKPIEGCDQYKIVCSTDLGRQL